MLWLCTLLDAVHIVRCCGCAHCWMLAPSCALWDGVAGVVAVQDISPGVAGWRIAATGVVLEQEAGLQLVKKLKLVGTPFKVGLLQ